MSYDSGAWNVWSDGVVGDLGNVRDSYGCIQSPRTNYSNDASFVIPSGVVVVGDYGIDFVRYSYGINKI